MLDISKENLKFLIELADSRINENYFFAEQEEEADELNAVKEEKERLENIKSRFNL